MEFSDLSLNARILNAIEQAGYVAPTPIQEQAIPPVLKGRDILGCAQTGTGKTAAFAVPLLHLLMQGETGAPEGTDESRKAGWAQPKEKKRRVRVLVLSPTRELSLQIYDSFKLYGKYLKLRYGIIIGGVSQHQQEKSLTGGVDVLVATPGRLLDLSAQGLVDLSSVEYFVLDEADRMLDMGFIHDVNKIIGLIPKKRQTLFFTATMPAEVLKLTKAILTDPVSIYVSPQSATVETTEQFIYLTDKSCKPELLKWLLQTDKSIRSALVFTRTKHGADKLVRILTKVGVKAMAIHGDKSQGMRQNALSSFKNGSVRVLAATDIAARGIDIDDLSHVINYDLPNIAETYVHRIGRTGRAGKAGVAISFSDFDEAPYITDIEKLINKNITVIDEHPYPMTVFVKSPPPQQHSRPPRRRF